MNKLITFEQIDLHKLIVGHRYVITEYMTGHDYYTIYKGIFVGIGYNSNFYLDKMEVSYYRDFKLNTKIGNTIYKKGSSYLNNIEYGNYTIYSIIKKAQHSMENRATQIVLRKIIGDNTFTY